MHRGCYISDTATSISPAHGPTIPRRVAGTHATPLVGLRVCQRLPPISAATCTPLYPLPPEKGDKSPGDQPCVPLQLVKLATMCRAHAHRAICVTPHATRAVAHPRVGRCKMRRVVGTRRPNLRTPEPVKSGTIHKLCPSKDIPTGSQARREACAQGVP